MLERRDLLLVKGHADRDRKVASGVQHAAATLVAGAAKSNFTACGCDVDSLSETGTRTPGWSTLGIAASIPLTRSRRRNEGAILKGGPDRTLADSATGGERPFESRVLFRRRRFQSAELPW